MNELGALFLIGAIFLTIILINDIRNKNFRNIPKYFIVGGIVSVLDIIIETIGTFNGFWTYNESFYFLFGTVPIELPLMFFVAGSIGKWIHNITKKIQYNLQLNIIFFALTFLGTIIYLRSTVLLGVNENIILFTVPAALWGFHTIKEDIDKASVLIVALFVSLLDYITEIIIIGRGSYAYAVGFSHLTPINYGLLTIAFFGLMERLEVLDKLLDYPIIKQIIQTAGVKRREYFSKIKRRLPRRK